MESNTCASEGTKLVLVKAQIYKKNMEEIENKYAFWLLKGYQQMADLMQGNTPKPPFEIDPLLLQKVANYVRKTLKRLRKTPPKVKKFRVVKFDANCYVVFEHNGRQYIKLMSLERGKRIVIPLLGHTKIEGNISVVLNNDGVDIHVSQEIKPKTQLENIFESVDFGYTEVMTDTQGYGNKLGEILTKATNERHQKMQKRHKLHSIEKKTKDPRKAKSIKKYNLGTKKLVDKTRKVQQTLDREINTAINELIEKRTPSILITEDLSHLFKYNKSKNVNRKFSSWVRGKIQDRISFKALTKGFRHEQVNPAYGSQTCPNCEFVDHRNRKADKFKCLFCGHEDHSDRVAALNYARRYVDNEIGLNMPYNQVKNILLGKFQRRLEAGQPVTVPGRTLETVD